VGNHATGTITSGRKKAMFTIGRSWMSMLWLATCPFLFGHAAQADTLSIKASLWKNEDKGGITLTQDHMKAGPVEFVVTNTSTDPVDGKMHEFLIAPWSDSVDALPYDSSHSVVFEDRLADLEGLEDMLPSATATMRVVLKPGQYVVFSNQLPGDYRSGMTHRFTVDP
jgi:hypothetical protein